MFLIFFNIFFVFSKNLLFVGVYRVFVKKGGGQFLLLHKKIAENRGKFALGRMYPVFGLEALR